MSFLSKIRYRPEVAPILFLIVFSGFGFPTVMGIHTFNAPDVTLDKSKPYSNLRIPETATPHSMFIKKHRHAGEGADWEE